MCCMPAPVICISSATGRELESNLNTVFTVSVKVRDAGLVHKRSLINLITGARRVPHSETCGVKKKPEQTRAFVGNTAAR